MIDFEPIDEETNIVDYPGYVGMTWDGELSISSEFKNFETFDWNTYSELIEVLNESRYFDYQFRNLNNHVSFEAYQDIGFLVNYFITVEVHNDDGSAYGGMASGRGYIFFLRTGFNLDDAVEEFNAVATALNEDLKSISS